ncbi:MAG: glutamine-hydrolyzing carbamoyl-phosphate synthase small subunit [Clostridia bacterium]|nr:glutamine-hydrolyzing carbamoyl-phosphate synthase small subunit [Clostridia bacterium]
MAALKPYDRKIVLESGAEYFGYGFGDRRERICEIVFNNSMVGYQEIVSDPAYTGQMVVMTYPLIGNYGIADDDFETRILTIGGLIVREYNDFPSNFRYTKTLAEILEESHIPGISGIDTRALTRSIRDNGSCRVMITDAATPKEEALARMAEASVPHDLVAQVSCRKKWYSRTSNHKFNVVAVDCGIKLGVIRALNARGCNVTIVPWNTTADEVLNMHPDGMVIAGGPGAPDDLPAVVELIRALRGKLPIFGIALGCQLAAMAYGAKTFKLSFGHHGGYPVKDTATGKIVMTSQNHIWAIDGDSLAGTGLDLTHINLADNTVSGIAAPAEHVFGVQFCPESAPGPQDSDYLFDQFTAVMKEAIANA